MKLLNCSPEEFSKTDTRNEMDLEHPRGKIVFGMPKVCIMNWVGDPLRPYVCTLTKKEGSNNLLFLWIAYRHMFEQDEGLPLMADSEVRRFSLGEICALVRSGQMHERAIAIAMELLL